MMFSSKGGVVAVLSDLFCRSLSCLVVLFVVAFLFFPFSFRGWPALNMNAEFSPPLFVLLDLYCRCKCRSKVRGIVKLV